MRKTNLLIILFLIIILLSSISFASTTTKFEVVEENICKIDLNEYSHFEKKLINKNLDKKQVTLQLKVTNDSKEIKPTGELMLVLDNSNSMNDKLEDEKTRYEAIVESANTLVQNLLQDNDNLKIGVVSFSSNEDVSKEGTLDDAKLVSELTNNLNTLQTSINTIKFEGYRTDLDSGITLAKKYYSNSDVNKYMIILTDGVPNIALDYDKNYYSDDVISKTKANLENLKDNNFIVTTMLTGIGDSYYATANPSTRTYGEIIENIFGTPENPKVGKYYYIQDQDIEKTITKDIYNDLRPQSQTINNIKIVDYFPKEIIENFDFAYVDSPNIGKISAKVDNSNNSITWTIDELKSQETAKVQYTLTLKDNYNSSIINKILDTNKKVDITFDDENGKPQEKTSDVTPKVRITENKTPDNTVAPTILPKTGSHILILTLSIICVVALILGLRLKYLNNNSKE